DVKVADGAEIRAFSHLESCHVGEGAQVGPYARLRPGADLAKGARVGNFVEIKNATIAAGAKVNHLSYVGDASVGEEANIGAGTITCNYDGVMKHRTEIGPGAFVGSNTLLVAPVKMGAESMTASGTVVTKDVPDGAMAIGRVETVNKPGFARKLMELLRAKKMKKGS
ncbi:MAG: bifunctional UDP-N-acetylglucosamine diphosphorylase/glucosamine-1-phosphate N-acetyltransferase GlmU, partial [Pseudomonadota bacterium]